MTYWNAYVGNLEMHGKGNFHYPHLDDAQKYPVAAKQHRLWTERVSARSGRIISVRPIYGYGYY